MQPQPPRQPFTSKLHPHLPTTLSNPNKDHLTLNNFKQALLTINDKRQSTKNSYQKVISSLQQIIQQLFIKNDCLTQQKHLLIKQNFQLRKQTQSLSNIIQVKKRLGQSIIIQNSQIFEIMIQSSSVDRGFSKYEDSYQMGNNTIGNILQQNSHIANKQQFIIMSNQLSQNISQNDENQISMSNIGRTQPVNNTNLQTPGLYRQNIYIQCNSRHPDGVIRSFYLSVMQKRSTSKHLIQVIQELRHDITTILFEPYPTNEYWVEMLINFLKLAHQGHFDTQIQVLQYIKVHKLIDSLLVKCLKSRIQFLFYNNECFQMPTNLQILGALANQFGLRMQQQQTQYVFYTKQLRQDQNLLSSDRDNASLQISLNNKNENILYVREEQPCFCIVEKEDNLQFSFFISVQCQLGISQYQINQDSVGKSFRCSQENNMSIRMGSNQFQLNFRGDHLDAVANVLNQRDMNSAQNSGLKMVKPFGHRRYPLENDKDKPQQPLNSSRFFLNRVGSKNASFEQ